MALSDVSLAQFNRIATGIYNVGQVDFKTKTNGTSELVKVNNHVWKTSKNNVELSPERILEVKEKFLNSLQNGGVGAEAMKEIRDRLGLAEDTGMATNAKQRGDFMKTGISPLTRAQVRLILGDDSCQIDIGV